MFPVRTILYATDFSANSAFAFQLACALARDYAARLVILHAAGPSLGHLGQGTYQPSLEGALEFHPYGQCIYQPPPAGTLESLQKDLVKLKPHDPCIVAEHRLEVGDPVPTILTVAKEIRADLIVLGTHGRTGLGRLLMGSVAEHVVRKAPCPVLIVKHPLAIEKTNQVSCPEMASPVPGISK